jgi:hypothetical protein
MRYFFHVMQGDSPELVDEAGIELPDDDTVKSQARRALSDLIRARDLVPAEHGEKSFKIVDELGRVVAVFDIAALSGVHNGLQTILALIGLSAFTFGEGLTQKAPEMLSQVSALGY